MMRPVVCGVLAMVLAASPEMAQTRAKAPLSAPAKSLADYSEAMENLAEAASPAVVQILVQRVAPVGQGDSQRMGFVSEQEATGSGVIVDPAGYIVTNAHVVQNARRIEVKVLRMDEKGQAPHGHVLPAKLVGLDRQVDIAVLKIEGTNLPTLSFLNSDTLRQGRLVMALGSPLGLQNTLTHGVVSATLRQLKPESPMVYIQTDAPINPGNSGGPLLDIEGKIVGINTMIYSESGGNEGIGFAIPANLAKDVYQKLRKDGRVRRGAIGVLPEAITPALASGLGLDRDSGVILSDVAPHGAADAAGLQPGDVLISIDGKPIREVRDLALTVFQRSPGDELKIVFQRGKEEMTKTVAVLERKNEPSLLADQASYEAALVRELGILAVTVDEKVTAILTDLRRLSGVAVAAVPAEYAGLNPGLVAGDVIYEVNTKAIASLDELKAAVKEQKKSDAVVLLVERMGQLIYVTATLE
ncbi:trypsin-like peptidase domain-containing protein [Paludibaculum fermentans]|uniref:Trypsin-like peptidase domain-containing protein n=1 Tax=Paludibaculum fermentans TaxID=1473598 RepID=A0A7S7NSD9_PALFE|nr:trypsin-like peptidase domain-containing protein [Paludibaculum fermentans]QOY88804.1 trypsin-like peptidase domain-containing protein [Paludibaculum fermentans]